MGSKKSRGGTGRSSRIDQQGKVLGKDAKMSKMKSEVMEEKLGTSRDVMKVVKKSSLSEIDEIFGNKRRKVLVAESGDSPADARSTQAKKKKKAKIADPATHGQGSLEKLADVSGGKLRKKTMDGYKVYAEEEIGWNKRNAGGTALCPFDCQCCF